MRVVTIGAVELFDAYYRVMDRAAPLGWDASVGVEGRKRLKQLDWLLLEVQRREVDHESVKLEKRGIDLAEGNRAAG